MKALFPGRICRWIAEMFKQMIVLQRSMGNARTLE